MAIPLLSLGSRALAAAQASMATVSHNIANANTTGYVRQEAVLATSPGQYTGSGFFGRGVDVASVRRHYDQFLTGAVRTQSALAAADTARAQALDALDGLFSDPELGVGAAIDGLFGAAGDLANRPADLSVRQTYLARAADLAQRITGLGQQLAQQGDMASRQVAGTVGQVNDTLETVRALNDQIARWSSTGQPPNDLLDQRDQAVQRLAGWIGVQVVPGENGAMNLFAPNGAPLLVGAQVSRLVAASDPADGARLALRLDTGAVQQWLDADALGGGSLAGVLRFRDEDLASATQQLGRLATVLADRLNAQHALGVDASGQPGGALFDLPAPVARGHAANTGSGMLTAAVADSSALRASDYRLAWDGSNYTITRLSDGQASTVASLPSTLDGLTFSVAGSPAAGDSFVVRPYEAVATGLQARRLAPAQLATGYAAVVQSNAANRGTAQASNFQVVRSTPDNTLAVGITFNAPPTSFNVTGLAGGNLVGVPYVPGQAVPPAPADYNGWRFVLDGAPAAGDSFSVAPGATPRADNRNALALGALANQALAGGATLNQAYAGLLADVGGRTASARAMADVSTQVQAEAQARQQNLSGVNLDEEAADLLRHQQAYQAAAKIIQTTQSLFDSLLAATGR